MPNLGGIDISPVILIIALLFLERFIFWIYIRLCDLTTRGLERRRRRRDSDACG